MVASALQLEDKYEIIETLNEGGMGVVFKVRHRLLDDIRVIKVIRAQLSHSENMNQRFLREARMATKIRNPGIAHLIDFAMDSGGNAYLEMEFIDGYDLKQVSQRIRPLGLGAVLEIARQTLDVLSFLHSRGVVHRDISPDNLMLIRDEEGHARIKLIDLGIAKSFEDGTNLTIAGTFLGKIRYSSPEQIDGEMSAALGPASDLYSFGIVLYELLLGEHPFKAETGPQLITAHLYHKPRPFSHFPDAHRFPRKLEKVLLRALKKAPKDRYQSAEDFKVALESLQAEASPPEEEFQTIFNTLAMPAETGKYQQGDESATEGLIAQVTQNEQTAAEEKADERKSRELQSPLDLSGTHGLPEEEPLKMEGVDTPSFLAHPIYWESQEKVRNRKRIAKLKTAIMGLIIVGSFSWGAHSQWKREFIPFRKSFHILPVGVIEARRVKKTTSAFTKPNVKAPSAKQSPISKGIVFFVEENTGKWLKGRLDARSKGASAWILKEDTVPSGIPAYVAQIVNNGGSEVVGSSLDLHFVLRNIGDLPARNIGARVRFVDSRGRARGEKNIIMDTLVIDPGEEVCIDRTIERPPLSRAKVTLFWKSDASVH